MINFRYFLCLAVSAVIAFGAAAQSDSIVRPVTSAFSLEVGAAHLADTYLTPLKYSGWHLGIAYSRAQCMAFDSRWQLDWSVGANFDNVQNPARNATMYSADITPQIAMLRTWRNVGYKGVKVGIGPALRARAGVLYLSRNGNNPAAAKGEITLGAQGFANRRFKIGRLPVTAFYQATLPVIGAFFTPDYGQLYYEIYLGERNGLVRPAVWTQYFSLDQWAGLDLHLGGNSLRLAYHGDITSTKVNGIVYRNVRHSFAIGVVTEWLTLSSRRKSPQNISAFY